VFRQFLQKLSPQQTQQTQQPLELAAFQEQLVEASQHSMQQMQPMFHHRLSPLP